MPLRCWPLAVFGAALVLTACGGGGGDGGSTTTAPPTTIAFDRSQLPEQVTLLAPTDSKVVILRDNVDQRLRSTSQGGIHEVLLAFRGPQSAFTAQCPAVPAAEASVLVVYFRGAFVTEQGQPANTAMASTSEANVTAITYGTNPTLDPFTWCRTPSVPLG